MRSLLTTSDSHRKGAVDGLNLFFGALLGANLGTLDGLRLVDYVQLVVVLAGTVMALRMVSLSGKRGLIFLLLAVYAGVLVALVVIPDLKPAGLAVDDLNRLVATLAVWLTFALGLELRSRRRSAPPSDDVG